MRLHHHRGAAVLLAAICTPVAISGQTITGRVIDDGTSELLPAVAVMLLDSTEVAVALAESDSVGRFFIEVPRAGEYRVHAERLGYGELTSEAFALDPAGSVELVLRMVPEPLELDGLAVTAESLRTELEEVGFFRRRSNSLGYFFDAEEIERLHPRWVTDVLRRVPAVRLSRKEEGHVVTNRRSYKPICEMKIVLNGSKANNSLGDLDFLVSSDQLIGIEVYPGAGGMGAPVQHRGTDAFCGIVMIWTR